MLLVPKPALVLGPGTQIPRLDQVPLRLVDIALGLDLLDANLQAVLGEDHVLGLHLVRRRMRDLRYGEIEVVCDEGCAGEDDEEDDDGEELAGGMLAGVGGG